LIGGYSEYTAVGDNVNAAQRLEGLASKPVTHVSLLERGNERGKQDPNCIAPIVMSRTAFLRSTDALQPLGEGDGRWEERFRSSFSLKGKGSAVEAYEIFPREINGDSIITRIGDLGASKLSGKVRAFWKDKKFVFDDALAGELAKRHFP
jgi:hypothetical protein